MDHGPPSRSVSTIVTHKSLHRLPASCRPFLTPRLVHFLRQTPRLPYTLRCRLLPALSTGDPISCFRRRDPICNSLFKSRVPGMPPNTELLTTSVLLIDGFATDRIHFADQLKRCSTDYEIVEAFDGRSGLEVYRSRRIDCVVMELSLPDQSSFQTLVDLVPMARRPKVAVIVLTHITHRVLWELAKQNGAYVCLAKKFTSGEDLDKAIQRAVAFVGHMPKEDRYRPL